jgi:hypothetical protein
MKFKLNLTGSKCNEYPQLTILHNQQVVYSGPIVDSTEVEVDLCLQEFNLIALQGINKSQGENGKWDTQLDSNGMIIADKWLSINNIWIDNISMGPEWVRSLTLSNDTGTQQFLDRTWWNNGSISFSIELPLLDWIINEKFIKVEQNIVASHDARSGERKFDYGYIQEKIKTIQTLIND